MERYTEYKDSGVEWIGDIPMHWAVAKLGLYAEKIGSGSTPRGGVEVYVDTGVPFIRSQNVHFDGLRLNGVSFIESDVHDSMRGSCVLEGDVLLNITGGSIGRCCVVNEGGEMNVNQHVSIIRVDSRLFNTYLNFLLQGDVGQSQVQYNLTGGNRDGLTIDGIGNFRLTVPPVEEQERIVAFLDERTEWIDEAVKKTEKKIALLKEQRASLINEVVTKGLDPDVEMKDSGVEWIGDIPSHWALRRGSTIGDYSKGSGITKGEVVEEGFPCVRYGELYTQFDHALHEPVSFIESPGQVLAWRGAIFITASGETVEEIGKCVVYLGDGEISVGGDIIVLDAAKDYDSEYLSYLINSEGVRCQRAAAGRGGIIVHIYSKNFRQMTFVHPPVEEQERIVAFLDERTGMMDEVIAKDEERIALLKEYRQSLISEVVTGKRRVLDEPVGLN